MAFDPDAYLNEGKNTSGFDPDAYLGIQTLPPPFQQELPGILKQAGQAVLASSPAKLTQKFMQTEPAEMQRKAGGALPILGGALGGPIGAAGGELLRQATGAALAPETVPQTPLGRAASVIGAGVAQEPKMLGAIPGVSQVGEMAGNLASKVGKGAAKFGEALTGAKAQDLAQAAKQGYSTYLAPSMEKAQQIFGSALEKAGIPGRPPLKQIIDPQLNTARKVALQLADKVEKGLEINAGEALQGRQAIDRIYNATPLRDRATRSNLLELRGKFDDALAGKSGALKEASTLYRQAVVKSNILNPFRVTKQGQYSAVAPMIAALAASTGLGSGHRQEGVLGGLGYLAASSPALAGLAATTGGTAARAFGTLASRPEVRQALMQALQKIMQTRQSSETP